MTEPDPAAAGGASLVDATTERPGETGAARLAHWDVRTLCGEAGEAILVHKGEHYRLRVTARGRLILTK